MIFDENVMDCVRIQVVSAFCCSFYYSTCVLVVSECVAAVDGVSSSGTPTPGADTTGDSRELSAESINRSGTESETK